MITITFPPRGQTSNGTVNRFSLTAICSFKTVLGFMGHLRFGKVTQSAIHDQVGQETSLPGQDLGGDPTAGTGPGYQLPGGRHTREAKRLDHHSIQPTTNVLICLRSLGFMTGARDGAGAGFEPAYGSHPAGRDSGIGAKLDT